MCRIVPRLPLNNSNGITVKVQRIPLVTTQSLDTLFILGLAYIQSDHSILCKTCVWIHESVALAESLAKRFDLLKLCLLDIINLGSPYLTTSASGSESPKLSRPEHSLIGGGDPKQFHLSSSSSFNFGAFRAPVGFPFGAHQFFNGNIYQNFREDNLESNNLDLVNPYMRHSGGGFNNANNHSPPLHSVTNGYSTSDNSPQPPNEYHPHHPYAKRDSILDYHNAYTNNNNNLPNSLLKKSSGETPLKSRSDDDNASTPPPPLCSVDNAFRGDSLALSRLHSESPTDCNQYNNNNRHNRSYENSSPVDSTKSFSVVSHRSSEEAGNNSESRSPPRSDYSPENLSNKKYGSGSVMLDHKLPLSFLGPPLAALHSMTEMKTAVGNSVNNSVNGINGPIGNSNVPNSVFGMNNTHHPNSTTHTQGAANPHGIDTILSKPPPPVTSAGISALTGGGIPRFSIAAAAAGMAQYLSQSQGAPLKAHAGHIVDRTHLYWPGLQGLVANPMAWRERLSNTMSANLSQSHNHQHHHHHQSTDKDGKKKHTRPTFSGQQIFALEKTFEQTKYLAGPERAKLAYALGMTESQVKVWFQNRRTKWRKRHAAEMATAKRKQDDINDGVDADGDCSETIDSDSESLDMGDPNRKRCRMEDEFHHN